MEMPKQATKPDRTVEVRTAFHFFTMALRMASMVYSATPPEQARNATRIALGGVIKLISELYPEEASLPGPLIQLRQDLDDLDRGKVALLFKPTKVSNRPPTALSEELFRAIVAAAMTRLMDGTEMSREAAAQDIARRLSKMGGKHSSANRLTPSRSPSGVKK